MQISSSARCFLLIKVFSTFLSFSYAILRLHLSRDIATQVFFEHAKQRGGREDNGRENVRKICQLKLGEIGGDAKTPNSPVQFGSIILSKFQLWRFQEKGFRISSHLLLPLLFLWHSVRRFELIYLNSSLLGEKAPRIQV